MDHERAQELLSDYLEGTLSPEDRAALQAHLDGCPACQKDLALLRRTLQLVKKLPPVEAPPQFASKVRRRARKAGLFGRARRVWVWRMMVPFEAALVILLAALGGLIVLQLLNDPVRPIQPEHPPLVVSVVDRPELERFAAAAWTAGGEVRVLDRAIPPGDPLGAAAELELVVAPGQWPTLRQALAEDGLAGVLPEAVPPPIEGSVRVLVQLGRREPTKP